MTTYHNFDGTIDQAKSTPAPPAQPRVFQSRLDFRRFAASAVGAGELVEIEEAFEGHASSAIRYAFKEFQDAETFTKEKVKEFLDAGVLAGCLTGGQRDAIDGNWPT